uniref:Uncharacterized protein n=1 Tax=Romanomermis culicivorax TaxID=13658 RepID=A0A915JZL8_ROMCU
MLIDVLKIEINSLIGILTVKQQNIFVTNAGDQSMITSRCHLTIFQTNGHNTIVTSDFDLYNIVGYKLNLIMVIPVHFTYKRINIAGRFYALINFIYQPPQSDAIECESKKSNAALFGLAEDNQDDLKSVPQIVTDFGPELTENDTAITGDDIVK